MNTVSAVASKPGGESSRDRFLNLVRSFPALEQKWHTGQLPRLVAVPAIGQLARLVRILCTVEEERGQPFLDPLQDTLARCKEFQSLYLTGSVGAEKPHERGDWINNEVRQLLDEAEDLSQSGAKIEAAAVATLAEWRARCLEFAAQEGPFSEVTDVAPPQQQEPPAPPEKAPEETNANDSKSSGPSEKKPAEKSEESDASAKPDETVHTVSKGENPSVIANKYNVSTADILKWNNLKKGATLHIGQKLVIKPGEKSSDTAGNNDKPKRSKNNRKKRVGKAKE